MKLCELDLTTPKRSLRQQGPMKGVLDKIYTAAERAEAKKQGAGIKVMGHGSYGQVYSQPRKTHDVVKYGKTEFGELPHLDGYLSFVDQVQQHGKGNPYLPQIYGVKFFQKKGDEVGQAIYKVNMEKLTKLEALSPEQMWAMIQRIFHKDRDQLIKMGMYMTHPDYKLMEILRDGIRNPERVMLWLKGADPQFLDALKVVRLAKMTSNTSPDIGHGNVMARLTPHGPQLVITDPLA